MIDILEYLKGLIESDKYLKTILGDRIYYYEPTENTNTDNIFIILTPITDTPSDYVSDTYLSEIYTFQIDVEGYNRMDVVNVVKKIRHLLWENNLYQASSQLDLYSDVNKRYIMSRRYKGIPKNQYYKHEHIE